jgi:RimJ/RimL family protein N-acetyltransferase
MTASHAAGGDPRLPTGSFADKPTLRGTRVTLRPIRASDAASMWAAIDDPDGRRLTGTHRVFTRDVIDEWAASRSAQPDRLDFAITDAVTGEWAGELAINDWDADNHSCNVRIAVDAEYRDRGFGTEAMRLAVDHVFEHLPIHRLGLQVFAFNERAIAVYRKLGFVHEGVERAALFWDGEYHDAVSMSILRPDWDVR